MLLACLLEWARAGWWKGLDTSCCRASPVNIELVWGDTGMWWGFSEKLRETLPFFWLGVWRCDWELPQIWDMVTEVRRSPSPCAVNRRAVPIWRDEWTPVWLSAALALGKCCPRNRSCFYEEGGGDFKSPFCCLNVFPVKPQGKCVCSAWPESFPWAVSHHHLLHPHVEVMVEVLDNGT